MTALRVNRSVLCNEPKIDMLQRREAVKLNGASSKHSVETTQRSDNQITSSMVWRVNIEKRAVWKSRIETVPVVEAQQWQETTYVSWVQYAQTSLRNFIHKIYYEMLHGA